MEEKKQPVFTEGIRFEKPKAGTPEWIKGKISVKVEDFYVWSKQHTNQNGFVNLDLKKSDKLRKDGTPVGFYLQLNDWKKPIAKPDFNAGEVEIKDDF